MDLGKSYRLVLNGAAQVNRKGDDVAQMATDYSALEIAYFKAVVSTSFLIVPSTS